MGAYGRLQRFVAVTVLLVWTLTGSSAYDTIWKMPVECVGNSMTALGDAVVILRLKQIAHFPYMEGKEPMNGGIPQNINMDGYLEDLKRNVEAAIPDFGFFGPAMIVLDDWHPVYEANTENAEYMGQLIEFVRKQQPTLDAQSLVSQARDTFEAAARKMLVATIKTAKDLRPNAKWGFYGLPACNFFDETDAGDVEWCKKSQVERNNLLKYLIDESKAIFPAIQAHWGKLEGWQKRGQIKFPIFTEHTSVHPRAVLNETSRFNTDRKPVFAYIRVSKDVVKEKATYLNQGDMCKTAALTYEGGAQDTLLWVERECDEAKQLVASTLAEDAEPVKAVQKTCPELSCWQTNGACA